MNGLATDAVDDERSDARKQTGGCTEVADVNLAMRTKNAVTLAEGAMLRLDFEVMERERRNDAIDTSGGYRHDRGIRDNESNLRVPPGCLAPSPRHDSGISVNADELRRRLHFVCKEEQRTRAGADVDDSHVCADGRGVQNGPFESLLRQHQANQDVVGWSEDVATQRRNESARHQITEQAMASIGLTTGGKLVDEGLGVIEVIKCKNSFDWLESAAEGAMTRRAYPSHHQSALHRHTPMCRATPPSCNNGPILLG